jgi:nucleotide-binding universal stress UspA family protein
VTFAAGIAAMLSAKLIACHCATSIWFTPDQHIPEERRTAIESGIREAILKAGDTGPVPEYEVSIIERSFEPAAALLDLSKKKKADLIVMKARKGVFSAFHFGSIVERVTTGAQVPVLILPAKFIDGLEGRSTRPEFKQVLFDYDFSEATDRLFPFAMSLTAGYHANLHLLSVLEPPRVSNVEVAAVGSSRNMLSVATQNRLENVASHGYRNMISVPATVEWGRHAETVLSYAAKNQIDLICTTLSPPYYYLEKFYCAYLGKLLLSARCPILVLRSV